MRLFFGFIYGVQNSRDLDQKQINRIFLKKTFKNQQLSVGWGERAINPKRKDLLLSNGTYNLLQC